MVGRDGLTLTEKWRDGASTLHGFFSRGFSNCFIVSLVQSSFSVNCPHMLDQQAKHLAYDLQQARARRDAHRGEPGSREDGWVRSIVDLAQMNLAFLESCTPGYYSVEVSGRIESFSAGGSGSAAA